MKVLVTGGAGYIGSVTVEALLGRGDEVVVVDNLSRGHRGALFPEAAFHQVDLLETARLADIIRSTGIDAAIHFAAFSLVGESVTDPDIYMRNNVVGTLSLLDALRAAEVDKLVFSSTCAIYGEPARLPITEDLPKKPVNPYGLTKLFMEQAMETYSEAFGLHSVRLRYFNAAGATEQRGEDHVPESHLIPLVLQVALGQREGIKIFGNDYPTRDGTCVRDYIHVSDLASAHLAALDYLADGGASLACNLGTGSGYTVREVIDVCREVTGHRIPAEDTPRRPGDPPELVAGGDGPAATVLNWKPSRTDLRTIVSDAWAWHQAHPNGYGD